MPAARKHRALIVGRTALGRELREILNGYGYFVEYGGTRQEGLRLFRAHRHALVILGVDTITGFPERLFRFFHLIHDKAIVLVACDRQSDAMAARYVVWGADDVLRLPIQRESLNLMLTRASTYHRDMVRDTFRRQLLWFGAAMLPLWAMLAYLALR